VVFPVLNNLWVDDTGSLVIDRLEIDILADRSERRLEDIALLARATVRARDQLECRALLRRLTHVAVRVP
jgi:hypothetical protein